MSRECRLLSPYHSRRSQRSEITEFNPALIESQICIRKSTLVFRLYFQHAENLNFQPEISMFLSGV